MGLSTDMVIIFYHNLLRNLLFYNEYFGHLELSLSDGEILMGNRFIMF